LLYVLIGKVLTGGSPHTVEFPAIYCFFSQWPVLSWELMDNTLGDSLHIAVFAVHGIDYLLTWNYRHIDNAETKPIIRKVCLANSYSYPEICTPRELMGVYENG
jgi:hypothetical protein